MSEQQVKSLEDFVNPDNKFLGVANHFYRPVVKYPAEEKSNDVRHDFLVKAARVSIFRLKEVSAMLSRKT